MSYRFFENKTCEYYPCHEGIDEINCLFCYCPMYHLKDCPGNPRYVTKEGVQIKNCKECTFPHEADHYDRIMEILRAQRTKNEP